MLNEDKMKLMTGIAMFEKREGRKFYPASRYFRSDYITSHLIRAFFSYTFCYALCVVIWVLYSSEQLLNSMSLEDYVGAVKSGGVFYLVGLILYLTAAGMIFNKKYEYAKRGTTVYMAKLGRLDRRYGSQNRVKEQGKGGTSV